MKRVFSFLALLVLSLAQAEAHALLDHAEPKVGSTVSAPSQVKIWFTEELEGVFSRLQVFDAAGTEVDHKDLLVKGSTMTVTLSKLSPGTYKVVWKAVSTDTHKTSGTFVFMVR